VPGLEVHVVSPEREVWSGNAEMVVAKGTDGDVGILSGHAPMLVSLAVHPVRIREGDRERVILVDGGFLHVTSAEGGTRVDVLAEHAALPEEIDVAEARSRAEELQRRVEGQGDTKVRSELDKTLMRVRFGSG
jgi:F-type H+-transporting ATPase subunit epsilon